MRSIALASIVVLLTAACVSTRPPAHSATPYVTVERAGPGYWRATWHLKRPTRELRFERRTPFRKDVFEPLTAGFAVERDGDQEILRTAGEAADTIAVRFRETTRQLPKEYDFFQQFSDGSVAIYTGHLVARPAYADDPQECEHCFVRSFRFVPGASEHVIAGGRISSSPVDWIDRDREGAYVYFGGIRPIESAGMISIVDPAMPQWLAEETRQALPRLFELYTRRFGVRPVERPTIFFNYVDGGGSGYSSGGGVLPGQIQLRIDGAAWKERSPDALVHLFHFLAHEAVHLWNGRIISAEDPADAWMHEGSADAIAERTLRDLGLTDEKGFLDGQSTALNECRRKLRTFPLRDAASRKASQLYYSCGNVLALFTEVTTRDRNLSAVWSALIEQASHSSRRTYGVDDYIEAWRTRGAQPDDVDRLRRFVEREAVADELLSMLTSRGVQIVEDDDVPESYGQSVARDALLLLMKEHCTGGYGFTGVADGLALSKGNSCGPIPAGGLVTKIGGHDVLHEGEQTWDVLHALCGTEGTVPIEVVLDGAARTVAVPCTRPVAARPAYVRIVATGKKEDPRITSAEGRSTAARW